MTFDHSKKAGIPLLSVLLSLALAPEAESQAHTFTPGSGSVQDGSGALQGAPPPPPPPDRNGALPMSFIDEAGLRGVLSPGYGRGAAMVDLDGDGRLDLIAAQSELPDAFLRQKADGKFEIMNETWQVPRTRDRGWGVLAADFDNDGDVDVYFPTGGFTGPQVNMFLRNDLDAAGVFVDITASSGDAGTVLQSNFGGTVLDFDNDGDLDIFLTAASTPAEPNPTCKLLRNDGGLQFADVSIAADIIEEGDYRHCSSGDINNDGLVDIAVGNFTGDNRLYRNNGDGTFTDIAASAGVTDPVKNFGVVMDDFDNDGWLDLYVAKYQFASPLPSGLLLNNGDSTFRDVRVASGMTVQGDMGHNVGDLNADGFPDIFIGTGHPNWKRENRVKFVRPSALGKVLVLEFAYRGGFLENGPTRTHGIAFGDIDKDGYLDVYTNNGGPAFVPTSWEPNALWMAQGNSNKWASVELIGVKSNRDAVGARASLTASDGRQVHRFRTIGKGFANTDAPALHFGLASSADDLRLKVEWPSGLVQEHLSFPAMKLSKLHETGVTTVGTPAVGGNVTVNVFGPPNGTVTLYSSELLVEEEDPLLGGIWRVGQPRTVGSTFPIGGDGKVNVTFSVPNDPGLAGGQLYVQALVEDPIGGQPTTLTNVLTLDVQ